MKSTILLRTPEVGYNLIILYKLFLFANFSLKKIQFVYANYATKNLN